MMRRAAPPAVAAHMATVSGVDRVLRRISYNKARQPQDAARLMRLADAWLDHRNRLTKGTNHA